MFTQTRIGDVARHVTVGFVGSMSLHFTERGVPLLRGQNVKPGQLDLTNLKFIDTATHQKWKKSALEPGDVVIVRVGYPGTAAVVPKGIGDLNAASLVIVRPDKKQLDARYLSSLLNSPWGKATIAGLLVGAAQQVLNTTAVADLRVPLPELPLQKRMADILSAYDDLIENCQRRIKILESTARALYREWFVHFRFPGHEGHRRVASPLGEIPEGWEFVPFSGLATYVNGFAFKPSHWGKKGKPIIKIKELKAGITSETPRNDGDSIAAKFQVQDGDVLFSWSADLDAYIWMGGDGLLNQHLFNVIPVEGFGRGFIFNALKEAMPRFRALSLGATMHHIKRSALDQVFALVPPPPLRAALEVIVRAIQQQVIVLTRQARNLRMTRDLLLPRLLSGQIDVGAA